MAGEQSKSDLSREDFPLHYALADRLNGTVEPFDVYQGPYVQYVAEGQETRRVFLSELGGVDGWAQWCEEKHGPGPCTPVGAPFAHWLTNLEDAVELFFANPAEDADTTRVAIKAWLYVDVPGMPSADLTERALAVLERDGPWGAGNVFEAYTMPNSGHVAANGSMADIALYVATDDNLTLAEVCVEDYDAEREVTPMP